MSSKRIRFWGIVLGLTAFAPAFAVAPRVGDVSPRGGQRGGEVEVRIAGNNLEDAVDLMFHDPGLTLSGLEVRSDRVVRAVIAIDEACTVGTKGVRVRTRSGISNLFLFSVGNLPEVDEAEPNNSFDEAQPLELNTTVNGTITSEDVDFFAVHLEAGQRIAVEVEAMRLGGPLFDPKLRLFGPERHERVSEDDTPLMQQDAAFVYTTEETGLHRIAVNDASFGGGGTWRYRLHVGKFPRPLAATPFGGQPEDTVKVAWLGDPRMDAQEIVVPAVNAGTGALYPASDLGVAPSPVPFRVSPYAGIVEVEPNNSRDTATLGTAPGGFDGVIDSPGDIDWFSFEGTAGQVYDIRVWARALGSPLDSVLNIHKPDGGRLASDDDGAMPDSLARVTLPDDGLYTFSVRDHLGRGGATFAYRVEVTPVTPALHVQTGNNNDEALLTVHQGNRTFLMLEARRSEFDGPVTLSAEDVPEGMILNLTDLPAGGSAFPLVVSALPDAPVAGALLPITARWADENQDLAGGFSQRIELTHGRNRTVFVAREIDHLAVAVAEPAPFIIDMIPPQAPVLRNGNKKVRIVARRSDGFDGQIDLTFPFAPDNVGTGTGAIPAGESETTLVLEGRSNSALGVHHMVVEGRSAGYVVCTDMTPVEVVEPWVVFQLPDFQAEQGVETDVVVAIQHSHAYEGTFEATIANMPRGVSAAAQPFTSETESVTFRVKVAEDAPVGKHGLSMRTVLNYKGEDMGQYSGGGTLQIFQPLPPELQEEPAPPEEPQPEQPERTSRFAQAAG